MKSIISVDSKKTIILLTFLSGLFSGLIFNTFAFLGYGLEFIPGDMGDGRLNNYFLENCYLFFCNKTDFWNAPFFFPVQQTITFSENLIGSAPLYSLFRWIGFDTFLSYQLWVVCLSILNFSAAYFFFIKIIKNPYSAALGAFVFAFSLSLNSQIVATQMYPRFPIPLALYFLIKFSEDLRPKYFFLSIFILVYQFYSSIYLGFFLLFTMFIILLIMSCYKFNILKVQIKVLNWWIKIGVGMFINTFLLLLLLYPYLIKNMHSQKNSFEFIYHSIPTIKSHFFLISDTLFWNSLNRIKIDDAEFWLHTLFPGALSILAFISVIILFLFKKKIGLMTHVFKNYQISGLIISGLILFFVFLRIENFSLYFFVFKIPGFHTIRNVCRIVSVLVLFYGVSIAILSTFLYRKNNIKTFLLFLPFLIILQLDNLTTNYSIARTAKKEEMQRIDILINKLKFIPKGSVISYQPDSILDHPYAYHIDAMIACQNLGLKCVNGYSGYYPDGFSNYFSLMNDTSRVEYFKNQKIAPDTVYVIH